MAITPKSKRPAVPEPPGVLFLGNIGEFKSEDTIQDFNRLFDTYGDIFRLRFPGGKSFVMVGSQKLVNEICDEKRFRKSLNTEVNELRHLANDGLFTARDGEENWGIAHRILVPAFGPVAIRGMFGEMHDVVSQLVLKWARHGASTPFHATEDFTRLALDTIALCSMDFRFNSFYKESLHPFVDNMGDVLVEAGNRFARPSMAKLFYRGTTKKFFKDIKQMRDISDEIIKQRRADTGNTKKDLLAAMMNGVDPRTGKKMSDSSITDNLITFLIAGHETTSGTLSFLFYHLLANPDTYQKAQAEVDEIMGRDPITVNRVFQLKYIPAALRETLRMSSPIPGIAVEALEDTLLDNKYPVAKDEAISPFFIRSHIDPKVFGEDALEFKPERMLDENFERLQKEFPNCWKPFGNGLRACIGRAFAWQEMLLAVSIILQNFTLTLDDPKFRLRLVETLTIKPKDLHLRASLRHGMTPQELEYRLLGTANLKQSEAKENGVASEDNGKDALKRMRVYYGSNSGTCEVLARRLANNAPSHGFKADIVESLDMAREALPVDEPIVVITSSYEGQPPDNAMQFVSWLKNRKGPLSGVTYAVFGVGNREWARTFHAVPKFVDSTLAEQGAERVVEMGHTDTADRDTFVDFEGWEEGSLWPALKTRFKVSERKDLATSDLTIRVLAPRSSVLRQDLSEAYASKVEVLAGGTGAPAKRHLEIRLPSNTTYRAGDYLCVLPINPREAVTRALRRFRLSWDAILAIEGEHQLSLPLNQPTSAWTIFSAYVELAQPATRRDISTLVEGCSDDDHRGTLERLASSEFEDEVMRNRVSVLDLLERFPSVKLPLTSFLTMLPPMRIRQYSISSSPLLNPRHVSITYSVLDEPALSGSGRHLGVATNYLSQLSENDLIHVAIRPSHAAFHLPLTPESTPIICIAAGAGIGPFRGFIQERSAQIATGRTLAPALLYFGCRGSADDLYREEFDGYEKQGAVTVRRAYSRHVDAADAAGCKYVQHRMLRERDEIGALWDKGAKLFVCGSRAVGKAVEEACMEILRDLKGITQAEAKDTLERIRNERFVMDIFD